MIRSFKNSVNMVIAPRKYRYSRWLAVRVPASGTAPLGRAGQVTTLRNRTMEQ
jgi:hypothetical protein